MAERDKEPLPLLAGQLVEVAHERAGLLMSRHGPGGSDARFDRSEERLGIGVPPISAESEIAVRVRSVVEQKHETSLVVLLR